MTDQATETKLNTLAELAKLRKLSQDTKDAIKGLEKTLEETPAYQRLIEAKESLREYDSKADEITAGIKTSRTAMIEEQTKLLTKEERAAVYAEFKENLPVGLGLRVNHTLKYEINQITDWCKENAKLLFKLDVKEFEKMADKVDVPGVEKIDVPTITIASDLSMYLEA